jgi:hypothetical protein
LDLPRHQELRRGRVVQTDGVGASVYVTVVSVEAITVLGCQPALCTAPGRMLAMTVPSPQIDSGELDQLLSAFSCHSANLRRLPRPLLGDDEMPNY